MDDKVQNKGIIFRIIYLAGLCFTFITDCVWPPAHKNPENLTIGPWKLVWWGSSTQAIAPGEETGVSTIKVTWKECCIDRWLTQEVNSGYRQRFRKLATCVQTPASLVALDLDK